MALPATLTTARQPAPFDRAREQIKELIQHRLAGRKIDVVSFMDEFLAIVAQVGDVKCSPATDHGLRMQVAGGEPFEVELDCNRSKLRILCARLAVLCQESGHPFMLYGGEGSIARKLNRDVLGADSEPVLSCPSWNARWTNTPGNFEFTISVTR